MKHRKSFVVVMVIVGLLMANCSNGDVQSTASSTAEAFIEAVAAGDEVEATSYLTSDAKVAVAEHCEGGMVLSCFDARGRQWWGEFDRMFFEIGSPIGDPPVVGDPPMLYVYSTIWSNTALWIGIEVVPIDGRWFVDGWRGFVKPSDDAADGLLDDSNPVNAFPPPEQDE